MTFNFLKRKKRSGGNFVYPDEVIMDSMNPGNFDQQQFEGRLEKPITKRTIKGLSAFFILFMLVFAGRLFVLQIKEGQAYSARSERNMLSSVIIFADRGIIYDRNGIELAWNQKEETDFPMREYLSPGFSHILGHVSSPLKDSKGLYWQTDYIGKDGLELIYNDRIRGRNGSKIIEVDALGKVHSENTINAPERGPDLFTTIDARISSKLHEVIRDFAAANSFLGGAGVIINAQNGEIIASTSYPEYDNTMLSLGQDKDKINDYLKDTRNIFLDRTISGRYTPGSIVKPIFALAALEEGIINPTKRILSTGSISIPNPYFPDQPTIFRDWKAHGWTDMSEAIAVSSDVYFYSIGGGYGDQKGLGIANLEKYARMFGIGEKTEVDLPDEIHGVIPSPEWKRTHFGNDPWRVGDTYNTSIGQYGFQVTVMEMARAAAALGNGGILPTPHLILNDEDKIDQRATIPVKAENLKEVQTGMREAVEYGTAGALNVPYVKAAAKTGTAQVGISKSRVNSWVVGFFPYENPQYAFTIMMESGPSQGETGASWVMRHLLDWMYWETPEYFGLPPKQKIPE